MLRELIEFLDDFLRRHGTHGAAKAALGLMSFAVLLGAVLGSTAVKSGALVTAILLLTAAGIALLAGRRADRRELEAHKRLVAHYGRLMDKRGPTYRIEDWEETITID